MENKREISCKMQSKYLIIALAFITQVIKIRAQGQLKRSVVVTELASGHLQSSYCCFSPFFN